MLHTQVDGALRLGGPTSDFLRAEIRRVGAPAAEVETALAMVADGAALDMRAYEQMSPRMRRLIDLAGAAGPEFSF